MANSQLDALRERFEAADQGHVFAFVDEIAAESPEALAAFCAELERVDLDAVAVDFAKCQQDEAKMTQFDSTHVDPPEVTKSAGDDNAAARESWRTAGLKAIAEGKVGLVLLAGGQGTRLGSVHPKGMYDIGMPSGKSLMHIQAQRLLKLQALAAEAAEGDSTPVIPWYIMTSKATHAETEEYFANNGFFGVDPANVFFFSQGMLPCLTHVGKLILKQKSALAWAPDGNGGIYKALRVSGALDDMEARGVEFVHAYCVDNCLIKPADPVFLGFCIESGCDCGAKVVPKAYPEEPVGVLASPRSAGSSGSGICVFEYSELSPSMSTRTHEDGELVFNAGNIANHYYTRAFLNDVVDSYLDQLPFHVARKMIPFCNEEGETVKPTNKNGIKLEKFIFDVFPFAENMGILEVVREDEFSPLKNKPGTGKDCPETARAALSDLHKRFATAAGATLVVPDGVAAEDALFEISPTVSYFGEGLEELCAGATFELPYHLTNEGQ